MAKKQIGKILYPLIVSDIYGVILYDGKLNDSYLGVLKNLSVERKIVCFSSMGQAQLDSLMKHENLSMISKFYSSASYDWSKHLMESYRLLADEEKVSTSDIIFIDDSVQNVYAAKAAGCEALLYDTTSSLMKNILDLGIEL